MPVDGKVLGAHGTEPRAHALIRHYEEIARASRSMLEAAHAGDWDGVERIEAQCRDMIDSLKRASAGIVLGGVERERRMACLRAILDDDAQIRVRAEPWLRELEDLLDQSPRRARQNR